MPVSRTSWPSLRPAGSPEATFSTRSCPRLPQASASLGQSAACVALAGHIGLTFDAGKHTGALRQEHLDHGVQVEQQAGARRARAARQARRAAADGQRGGEHQRQGLRSVYAAHGSNPRLADPKQPATHTFEPCLGQSWRRPRGTRVRSRPRTPLLTSHRRITAPTPPSSRARHPPQPTWTRPVRASQMHGTSWLRCRSSCEDRLTPSRPSRASGHRTQGPGVWTVSVSLFTFSGRERLSCTDHHNLFYEVMRVIYKYRVLECCVGI